MFTRKSILITLFLAISLILSSCAAVGISAVPQAPDQGNPTKPSVPAKTQPAQNPAPGPLAPVTSVEIQSEGAAPGQVNAIVHGSLTEACATLGEPQVSYKTETFMVQLPVVSPTDRGCAQIITPFEQAIPLDIAKLPAGDYTVKVNGVSAVFSLPVGQSQAPATANPGEAGPAKTYTSELYHFQFSIPAGWTAAVDKNLPSGAGSDPEYITLAPDGSQGLPRMRLLVQTGAPAFTGYENCEKNMTFRSLAACKISLTAGQIPATEMMIFRKGNAYYFVTLEYENPESVRLFNDLLTSFQFTD